MAATGFTVRNLTRGTVLAERVHGSGSFVEAVRGLMFRATLPPGEGLWLPGVNNIHMLFMRFPIDAVFVDRPDPDGGRRVVAIRPGLRPWRGVVWWVRGAHGVLELPVGTAQATGAQPGDRLVFGPAG